MYLISSRSGHRHKVDGGMPDSDTALRMWKGQEKAVTVCGRHLTPVNFYDVTEPGPARYQCAQCFAPADVTCPTCGYAQWDFTGPGSAECANGHRWDQGPAIPGTLVRPGYPGDVNDPERYPDDDNDDSESDE